MGRKPVKKPTVGHLWTVSPLPLPSIPMLFPGASYDFAFLTSTPERVPPPDEAPPTSGTSIERVLVFVFASVASSVPDHRPRLQLCGPDRRSSFPP